MSDITPDFSDPRKREPMGQYTDNNPHKKINEGKKEIPQQMEELADYARREARKAIEAGKENDMATAFVTLAKAVGIIINGISMMSHGVALAMKDSKAATITMQNLGRQARESFDSYKAEINGLKQRVTELEEKGSQ